MQETFNLKDSYVIKNCNSLKRFLNILVLSYIRNVWNSYFSKFIMGYLYDTITYYLETYVSEYNVHKYTHMSKKYFYLYYTDWKADFETIYYGLNLINHITTPVFYCGWVFEYIWL